MRIEWCRDVCARAYWQPDEVFPNVGEGGQYNCPYHFGVTSAAAIVDGRINCKHFKAKRGNDGQIRETRSMSNRQ